MKHPPEVITFSRGVSSDAIKIYFEPFSTMKRWLKGFLRMPTLVAELSANIFRLATTVEEQARKRHDQNSEVESILKELGSLSARIDSVANRSSETPTSQARAERTIAKYVSVANEFHRRGDIPQASKILTLLDDMSSRLRPSVTGYIIRYNIGQLLFEQGQNDLAERYFLQVLDAHARNEDYDKFSRVIAITYSRLALMHYFSHEYRKAAEYSSHALQLFEHFGDQGSQQYFYVLLAKNLAEGGTREQIEGALRKAAMGSVELRSLLLPEEVGQR